MEIISRKDAKAQGLKHYFTGKPCKNGHVAQRFTSKGICMECNRAHNTALRADGYHRDYYANRMATDESFRKAKCNDAKKHYHNVMKHDEERMAKHYARLSVYQKENKETCNRARRAHTKRNPGYDRIYTVAYRANINLSDLTESEQIQVRAIYKLRARISEATGIEHHVDHHIPLSRGGKHHPDNLWVIPASENLSKGAKLPSELNPTAA